MSVENKLQSRHIQTVTHIRPADQLKWSIMQRSQADTQHHISLIKLKKIHYLVKDQLTEKANNVDQATVRMGF